MSAYQSISGRAGEDIVWVSPITWVIGDGPGTVDLTGCYAVLTITSSSGTGVVKLTPGSGLTLGGTAGTITPYVSAAQTTAIGAGNFTWSLTVTMSDSSQITLLQGAFVLS